jgi:hypothetical protein
MPFPGEVRKQLVDISAGPNECWPWVGATNKKTGYGKKQVNGRSELAHRWVYETLLGPIKDGMVINHLCSNRECVNPHHLEVVSQMENCQHGAGAKLTKEQVAEIKAAKSDRVWGDGKRLAEKYGVTGALIFDIWNGRAWTNV